MFGKIRQIAILSLVFIILLSISTNSASAISDDEFYKKFEGDVGKYSSKLYYDKSTSNFYIKSTKYRHGGNSYNYDTWLYYVNDNGKTKEMDRLSYSYPNEYHYSVNNKSCEADEYSDKYFFLDNKYAEIDTEIGMTDIKLNDFRDKHNADVSNIDIELLIGETKKLSEKVIFNEKDKLTVNWTSSDSNVATVSNDGTVKAVKNGSCTISAKVNGLKYNIAEYNIKVNSEENLYFDYVKQLQHYDRYIGYKIIDLDGDGTKELVVKDWDEDSISGDTNYLYVYNVKNGTVVEKNKLSLNESLSGRVYYDPYMYLAMRSDGSIYVWSLCGINDVTFYIRKYIYINGEFIKESSTECKSGDVEDNIKKFKEESLPFLNINSQKEDYMFYDSDIRLLTDNELKNLSKDELQYAINEIYARYGYDFKTSEIKEEFERKSWYSNLYTNPNITPTHGYEKQNIIEDKNIKKILEYEKKVS